MANKYLDYISDDHFLSCIGNLYKSYLNSKNRVGRSQFYSNKIDVIKLTFDSKFNDINEEDLINSEILRQMDKSINNFIGNFHEEILGGVSGYELGNFSGYDIKASDDTLFADIKNKHNTMNSSSAESLFQKLAKYADTYKKSKCYWVQIFAKGSFNTPWKGLINGKEYSHSRVYRISGDQFYEIVTKKADSFLQLYQALPIAIDEYLTTVEKSAGTVEHSALSEIKDLAQKSNRTMIDQITFDNYSYYKGFDKL